MSLLDKFVSVVMPTASEKDRAEASRNAENCAADHPWLAMALQHHRQIEQLFVRAKSGGEAAERLQAFRELGALLSGHSNAEEAVIYPLIAERSGKIHAVMAYEEQAMTKVQMAKLERIDPMSQEWIDKLEHIEGAVQEHVYQEESSWFIEVANTATSQEIALLNRRFSEEFERYHSNELFNDGPARAPVGS